VTRLRTVLLGEALAGQSPNRGHTAGKNLSPAFSTRTPGALSAAAVCPCRMEPGSASLKPLGGHPGSLKTEKTKRTQSHFRTVADGRHWGEQRTKENSPPVRPIRANMPGKHVDTGRQTPPGELNRINYLALIATRCCHPFRVRAPSSPPFFFPCFGEHRLLRLLRAKVRSRLEQFPWKPKPVIIRAPSHLCVTKSNRNSSFSTAAICGMRSRSRNSGASQPTRSKLHYGQARRASP
jgi:hypothetical protein